MENNTFLTAMKDMKAFRYFDKCQHNNEINCIYVPNCCDFCGNKIYNRTFYIDEGRREFFCCLLCAKLGFQSYLKSVLNYEFFAFFADPEFRLKFNLFKKPLIDMTMKKEMIFYYLCSFEHEKGGEVDSYKYTKWKLLRLFKQRKN